MGGRFRNRPGYSYNGSGKEEAAMVVAILLIIALVLFLLAANGTTSPRFGLMPAGLAFLTGAVLYWALAPMV